MARHDTPGRGGGARDYAPVDELEDELLDDERLDDELLDDEDELLEDEELLLEDEEVLLDGIPRPDELLD